MNLFFPSNNALANALYANNNRISELPGMRRYYVADRNRNKLRALAHLAGDRRSCRSRAASTSTRTTTRRDLRPAERQELGGQPRRHLRRRRPTSAPPCSTPTRTCSAGSAGNTYTANSNAATITGGQAGAVGLSGNSCDGYTTLQQRNNNNKLDPCLNWFADRLDKVNTVGVATGRQGRDGQAAGR